MVLQRLAFVLFWLVLPGGLLASNVVVDLDRSEVEVTTTFHGTKLLLFGAVRTSPETTGLIMTVEGPPETATLRRKGRLLGMWFNLESETLEDVPAFYQVFATEGLRARVSDFLFQPKLDAGVSLLDRDQTRLDHWRRAYIETAERAGLIHADLSELALKERSLFRAYLDLPSNVTPGRYEVTVHELSSDRIIATTTSDLTIRRKGLNARLFQLATDYAALYGLLCIGMAAFAGFAAARLLR